MTSSFKGINVEVVKYMLMVQDMKRAIIFYRDVIGLTVKVESPGWTELAFGNSIIALHSGGTKTRTKTGLSIQVSDLTSACEKVASTGCEIVQEPQSRPGEPIKLAILLDTEGNEFMMTEYLRN